jgi:hypothetical protein
MEISERKEIWGKKGKEDLSTGHAAFFNEMGYAKFGNFGVGQRHLKKEQIPLLAEILKADKDELITLWLVDQVFDVIKDESMADEALKSVSRKIKKKK